MSKLDLWNDDYGNGRYEPIEPNAHKLPNCDKCGTETARVDDDDDHGNDFSGFYCNSCGHFKED